MYKKKDGERLDNSLSRKSQKSINLSRKVCCTVILSTLLHATTSFLQFRSYKESLVSNQNCSFRKKDEFRYFLKPKLPHQEIQPKLSFVTTFPSIERKDNNNENFKLFDDADSIMEKLCSPAPRSLFVLNQSVLRLNSVLSKINEKKQSKLLNLIEAEELEKEANMIRTEINSLSYLVKRGYKVELSLMKKSNVFDKINDSSSPFVMWDVRNDSDNSDSTTEYMNVLDLAHEALDSATLSSNVNSKDLNTELNYIAKAAEHRLSITYGTDLVGNQAAEAAFLFALSGITSVSLYDDLTQIAYQELCRCGPRSSFKPKHIFHMVEKLAAAGIVINRNQASLENDEPISPSSSSTMELLAQKAVSILETKGFCKKDQTILQLLSNGDFDLFSERVPLWLWRFSSKQKKIKPDSATNQFSNSQTNENCVRNNQLDWSLCFQDPKKPLIIDVGCGMGLSILGLSTVKRDSKMKTIKDEIKSNNFTSQIVLPWDQCNYLGADLNDLFIGYARGIAMRWGLLNKRIHFATTSAENILEQVYSSYPGPVQLIMIQYPTPYRLQSIPYIVSNDKNKQIEMENDIVIEDVISESQKERGYNPQLPLDHRVGFMVSANLLSLSSNILNKCKGGYLLLQSNCEDVAVTMKKMAQNITSLQCCIDDELITKYGINKNQNNDFNVDLSTVMKSNGRKERDHLPRRTQEWVNMGGERAEGLGWYSRSLIPKRGTTETELQCILAEIPIHRCLFQSDGTICQQIT